MERKIIYLDDAIDALRYAQHRFTVADEAGGMGTAKWSEDVIYFATAERVLAELPSAQPEWNNHTVACLLAEMFGEDCACNLNGIDEWLPEKCELLDSCPHPVGVACWEQFLKYKAERRTDDQTDKGASC